MGPKNVCSYADLAMGLIDEKAKFGGAIKPQCYGGDIGMMCSIFGPLGCRNYWNLRST